MCMQRKREHMYVDAAQSVSQPLAVPCVSVCECVSEYSSARHRFAAGLFLFFPFFLRKQRVWESLNFCH